MMKKNFFLVNDRIRIAIVKCKLLSEVMLFILFYNNS